MPRHPTSHPQLQFLCRDQVSGPSSHRRVGCRRCLRHCPRWARERRAIVLPFRPSVWGQGVVHRRRQRTREVSRRCLVSVRSVSRCAWARSFQNVSGGGGIHHIERRHAIALPTCRVRLVAKRNVLGSNYGSFPLPQRRMRAPRRAPTCHHAPRILASTIGPRRAEEAHVVLPVPIHPGCALLSGPAGGTGPSRTNGASRPSTRLRIGPGHVLEGVVLR